MPRPCCLPAPLTDGGCPGSEWHERGEAPVDPIVLIKTRYSAFAYCLPEYIRATTSESGPEFDPRTEEWDAKLVDFCKTYSFRKLSGDVLGVSIEECRFWSPLRSKSSFQIGSRGLGAPLKRCWCQPRCEIRSRFQQSFNS